MGLLPFRPSPGASVEISGLEGHHASGDRGGLQTD
jgi:hypothetical protein